MAEERERSFFKKRQFKGSYELLDKRATGV